MPDSTPMRDPASGGEGDTPPRSGSTLKPKPGRQTADSARDAADAGDAGDAGDAEPTENAAIGSLLGGAVAGPLGVLAGGVVGANSAKRRR